MLFINRKGELLTEPIKQRGEILFRSRFGVNAIRKALFSDYRGKAPSFDVMLNNLTLGTHDNR